MSESNVGGISWTVDADTKGAVDSIAGLDSQVKTAEKSLGKLDSSTDKSAGRLAILESTTKKYMDTLRKTGSTVSSNGVVLDKYGNINAKATAHVMGLANAHKKLSKDVKKGLAGMGRGAGQAGIQFQQFIGQVQGGQGVMLALSQQSADLGFVLGAPLLGAVAGITASLVGMLLPSLMDSKSGMEKLEKATENVKAAMTLGTDGVIEYTAEMKKLKQISETLTEIKLANLIAEQNAAFKIGIKEIGDLVNDAGTDFVSGQLFDMKTISKEGRLAFKTLNDAAKELQLDPTIEGINKVESALHGLSQAGVDSKEAGRELTKELGGLISEFKLGQITIDELKKGLEDTNRVTDDATDATKKHGKELARMIEALQLQAATVGMTERQTAQYAATRKGATQADRDAIDAAFDLIEADKKKAEAQKEIDRLMEESFKNEQKRENEERSKKKKAVGVAENTISSGMSPIERLQAEHEQLLALKEKYTEESALFDEALTVNAKKQADLRMSYQISNANLMLGSSAQMFGSLADMLKNSEGEQSSAYKAMFAISKGFAVAQAGLNLALAISNASAVTPWYASLAAVAQTVSAGAGFASAISNATYSGREHGGGVMAGQTYEVGEKNKPEMLMIPGNNGKVFSNAEMKSAMGGGGGGSQVIVNNYAAADGYTAKVTQDPMTHAQVIDIVIDQMTNPNSKGRRGQQANSNMHGVLNGTRRS